MQLIVPRTVPRSFLTLAGLQNFFGFLAGDGEYQIGRGAAGALMSPHPRCLRNPPPPSASRIKERLYKLIMYFIPRARRARVCVCVFSFMVEQYFWRILDVQKRGFITSFDVYYFLREVNFLRASVHFVLLKNEITH
jgi:hypothetical protein